MEHQIKRECLSYPEETLCPIKDFASQTKGCSFRMRESRNGLRGMQGETTFDSWERHNDTLEQREINARKESWGTRRTLLSSQASDPVDLGSLRTRVRGKDLCSREDRASFSTDDCGQNGLEELTGRVMKFLDQAVRGSDKANTFPVTENRNPAGSQTAKQHDRR